MSDQMIEFLSVGMGKYKQASATMVAFGKEIEVRLQSILSARSTSEWGWFVPNQTKKKTRSTKYWSEYPLFNAKIDGRIGESEVTISIDVNWYDSERDYPFYSAWLTPADRYRVALEEFEWRNPTYGFSRGVRLDPDEDDFDLERDFRLLLDELSRFLEVNANINLAKPE